MGRGPSPPRRRLWPARAPRLPATAPRQVLFERNVPGHRRPHVDHDGLHVAGPANQFGWSLGDVDSESVVISAVGTDGVPLTVAELGFQSAFNYVGAADLPTVGKIRKGGGREGRATHALARRTRPTNPSFFLQWDPASSTLLGNVNGSPPGTDTQGAAGYFVPTRAISTLSFSGVNIL